MYSFYYFFPLIAVLDAEVAEAAAAHELDAAQQEESDVWEIVGKLACLAQAFGGSGAEDGVEEDGHVAVMLEQMKKLQQETANKTLG
jgi:hypothetical protein